MNSQREHGGAALSPVWTVEAVSLGLIESAGVIDVSPRWEFDAVYRREYPGLIAVAAALTGDRDGAQDLVQDTMVKAFIRWGRVSQLDRPGAWCHHVLVNACRSRLRRRATEWRYLSRLRRGEPTSPEPSADTLAFWTVVRTLPSRPRAVVALYFGADLSSVQVAEVLGVPEGTVRSDLKAARRVVMNALGDGRND
ncbi:MAG: sigma-70 family RNA polymerase sigma factor [Ilumatobacteraceae bacterium]